MHRRKALNNLLQCSILPFAYLLIICSTVITSCYSSFASKEPLFVSSLSRRGLLILATSRTARPLQVSAVSVSPDVCLLSDHERSQQNVICISDEVTHSSRTGRREGSSLFILLLISQIYVAVHAYDFFYCVIHFVLYCYVWKVLYK